MDTDKFTSSISTIMQTMKRMNCLLEIMLMQIKGENYTNYHEGLLAAAFIGNIKMVKFNLLHGANNLNSGLLESTEGGHLDIVKLMVDSGADSLKHASVVSLDAGRKDIFIYLTCKSKILISRASDLNEDEIYILSKSGVKPSEKYRQDFKSIYLAISDTKSVLSDLIIPELCNIITEY